MITNETKIKKFVQAVVENFAQNDDKEIFLSTDDVQSICLNSNYLPHNHSGIYLFVSLLLNKQVLQRVQNGKYLFDTKKTAVFL